MISNRPNQRVAVSEREAFLRFTGLDETELQWVRLEHGEMPEVNFHTLQGIIMCGSSDDVSAPQKSATTLKNETFLRDLLRQIIDKDFPFLGVCYGLGLLTDELGGTVGYDVSEDIQASHLSATKAGRADPLVSVLPNKFRAYVGHHESVLEPAADSTVLVTGEQAPCQMVRVQQNLYATQFHPELDLAGILLRIEVFADAGYFPTEDRHLVEERVRAYDVSSVHQLLSRFVEIYS